MCCAGRGATLELLVYPSGEWKVPEDTQHNLTVSLQLDDGEVERALSGPATAVLEVAAIHREAWRLEWQRQVVRFSPEEAAEGVNKTLTFSGYYWGRTHVGLFLTRDDLVLGSPGYVGDHPPGEDLHFTWRDLNATWGDSHPNTNLTLLNDVHVSSSASPVRTQPCQPYFASPCYYPLPFNMCLPLRISLIFSLIHSFTKNLTSFQTPLKLFSQCPKITKLSFVVLFPLT